MELPIPHIWGDEQVAGTAEYVDDIPHFKDELYLVLVTSTRSEGGEVPEEAAAAAAAAMKAAAAEVTGKPPGLCC